MKTNTNGLTPVIKLEQTFIDKSDWQSGPWKNEPDRVSWVDPNTGYHCLVRRNNKFSGVFCGYVAVENKHPYYGHSYSDNDYEIASKIRVHGGITYANPCRGDGESGICHLTKDDDSAWWFGFDCGHSWDFQPGEVFKNILYQIEDCIYRDLAYVIREVESLASQLKFVEVWGEAEL